jgi:hypothetical protein
MKIFCCFICVLFCLSFVFSNGNESTSDLKINAIKYVKINTMFHDFFSINNTTIEEAIKSKSHLFTKHIKDIGNNEIFIQEINSENGIFLTSISAANEPGYELLLVVNKSTRNAQCTMIGFNFLGDSETYTMTHEFVNDSTLRLQQYAQTGGEVDSLGNVEDEDGIGESHILRILQNGEFVVAKN